MSDPSLPVSFGLRDFSDENGTIKPSALRDPTRPAALRGDDFATVILDPLAEKATLAVKALGYTTTEISWTLPKYFMDIYGTSGAPPLEWSAMMVMRSTTGFALTVHDGVLVYSNTEPTKIPPSVIDTGLTSGRWYYYTLFLRLPGALPIHQRVATADVLVPKDWGNRDKSWFRVPEWYRQADERQDASGLGGPLRRFTNVLGYTMDEWRTYVESLLWVRKADQMGIRMLPAFGALFGAEYEPNIGDGNFRTYADNLVHLRRIKGTAEGVRQMIAAISHYRADVSDGANLLPTPYGDARSLPIGGWGSVTNLAAGQPASGTTPGYDAEGNLSGYSMSSSVDHIYYHSNVAVTPGVLSMPEGVVEGVQDWNPADPAGRWHGVVRRARTTGGVQLRNPAVNVNYATGQVSGIVIKPSTQYTVRIYTHGLTQTGRQFRVGMWYRDQHGGAIGADFTWMAATSVGTFVRHTFTTTSPANAASVVLALDWASLAVNEEQVFLFPMLFEGIGAPAFESPQAIKVCIRPQRINFARNPDFDNAGAQWLLVNATAAAGVVTMGAGGGTIAMDYNAPVDPDGEYSFSADAAPSGFWSLGVTWYKLVGTVFDSNTEVLVDNAAFSTGRVVRKGIKVPEGGADLVKFKAGFSQGVVIDRILIDPTGSDVYFDGDVNTGERNDFRYDIPSDRNTYSFYSFNFKAMRQRIEALMVEYVPLGTPVLYDWDCLGPAVGAATRLLTFDEVRAQYPTLNALDAANPTMDDIPKPDV